MRSVAIATCSCNASRSGRVFDTGLSPMTAVSFPIVSLRSSASVMRFSNSSRLSSSRRAAVTDFSFMKSVFASNVEIFVVACFSCPCFSLRSTTASPSSSSPSRISSRTSRASSTWLATPIVCVSLVRMVRRFLRVVSFVFTSVFLTSASPNSLLSAFSASSRSARLPES